MRKVLNNANLSPQAQESIRKFHSTVVDEIEQAIQKNEWVIVGMAQNIFVKKSRSYLTEKNIAFCYIEHGSYFSKWKQRLAIKIWSGWPTFPRVFHKGVLIGGYSDLKKYVIS